MLKTLTIIIKLYKSRLICLNTRANNMQTLANDYFKLNTKNGLVQIVYLYNLIKHLYKQNDQWLEKRAMSNQENEDTFQI